MAHILLAEDDESLRKFLAQALVKAGHAVTDFGDGSDAYECLKGFRFDLLLTDIVMPGMDGIELAKRAAEMNAGAQDHVHHRLCRRGAAPLVECAQTGQGPVQAVPSARDRGRSGPHDRGLSAGTVNPANRFNPLRRPRHNRARRPPELELINWLSGEEPETTPAGPPDRYMRR